MDAPATLQVYEIDVECWLVHWHVLLQGLFLWMPDCCLRPAQQVHRKVQALQAAMVTHPCSQNIVGGEQQMEVCESSICLPDQANRQLQLQCNSAASFLVSGTEHATNVRILQS